MRTKVVVTGGAGFIGSQLVKSLVSKDYDVVVLDDLSTGHADSVCPGARLVIGSVTSLPVVEDVIKGAYVVFHLAAIASVTKSVADPITTFKVNVGGTVNILDAAKNAGVNKVVFVSSSSVYGNGTGNGNGWIQSESNKPEPLSPYALSKLIGEQYCDLYSKLYGLSTVCLRFFNVYGESLYPVPAYGLVIPVFIELARKNEPLPIYGDGEQTRDFVFIDDTIRAAEYAVRDKMSGVYNVGSGKSISIYELAKMIIEFTKSKSTIEYHKARAGDAQNTKANILKIESAGFQPDWLLASGLRRMIG